MKQISLTQNQVAIIDDEDYERVAALKWCALKWKRGFYAGTHASRKEKSGPRTVLLHRFIMGNPVGMDVDHINHNTLDNRRSNLRACTRSQNQMNRCQASCRASTGAIGVTWHKRDKSFMAHIEFNGGRKHLGYHDTLESAIKARKRAEKIYFGEFANTSVTL